MTYLTQWTPRAETGFRGNLGDEGLSLSFGINKDIRNDAADLWLRDNDPDYIVPSMRIPVCPPEDKEELEALSLLAQMRNLRCEPCGSSVRRKYRAPSGKNKRQVFYECPVCYDQFSPTAGTVFQDSHLPLRVWFSAINLLIENPGLSMRKIQSILDIGSYKTAWRMVHLIRKAM